MQCEPQRPDDKSARHANSQCAITRADGYSHRDANRGTNYGAHTIADRTDRYRR